MKIKYIVTVEGIEDPQETESLKLAEMMKKTLESVFKDKEVTIKEVKKE